MSIAKNGALADRELGADELFELFHLYLCMTMFLAANSFHIYINVSFEGERLYTEGMERLTDKAIASISPIPTFELHGTVVKVLGLLVEIMGFGKELSIGSVVHLRPQPDRDIPCEVIGFRESRALLMPFGTLEGVGLGCPAVIQTTQAVVFPDDRWLGRVINALGKPIDGNPGAAPVAPAPSDADSSTGVGAAHMVDHAGEALLGESTAAAEVALKLGVDLLVPGLSRLVGSEGKTETVGNLRPSTAQGGVNLRGNRHLGSADVHRRHPCVSRHGAMDAPQPTEQIHFPRNTESRLDH